MVASGNVWGTKIGGARDKRTKIMNVWMDRVEYIDSVLCIHITGICGQIEADLVRLQAET